MKLTWCTDIHLNFVDDIKKFHFFRKLRESEGEAIIITGDIGEHPESTQYVKQMANYTKKPIFYVLGNHDYWRSTEYEYLQDVIDADISSIRADHKKKALSHRLLHYVSERPPTGLSEGVWLTGCDGWYDGRNGNFKHSGVVMNDWWWVKDFGDLGVMDRHVIYELSSLVTSEEILQEIHYRKMNKLLPALKQLAKDDAARLRNRMTYLINTQDVSKIIILTHVPPFKQVCMDEGKPSGEYMLPFYTNKTLGDMLLRFAQKHSEIDFLVLCGHSHSAANYTPLDNLVCFCGKAKYKYPAIAGEIDI